MIRVFRGSEPKEMRLARRRFLAAAILARRAGRSVDFSGYAEMKELLVERLNYKCVYCEFDLRREGNPVEHFRPKARVENEGNVPDPDRYWWLAWTWENLFFACGKCNTHQKKNQFPLEPGSAPLDEYDFDLDKEKPLLVDPENDEPRDHIRFRWSPARQKWLPYAFSNSARGAATIKILNLDEDDHAQQHVEHSVMPWVEQLEDTGDNELQKVWTRATRSLFAPNRPFHALSWDVLDMRFPRSFREKHRLQLPVLGDQSTRIQSNPIDFDQADDPPEFYDLSDDLKLKLRALPDAEKGETLRELLEEVQSLRSWTNAELARLFGRAESTIKRWLRQMP
ncbi:MAG: hypothetical protein IPM54_11165 [Polyangiaceae bacterium]|nr:hypothetical protein [Polyangiaceae bacterium]